jgi:hypothetical protein
MITSEDLYLKWADEIRDDRELRYLHANREEVIDSLVCLFFNHKVSFEEAKTFENKVVRFLTTEEGRKGKGKYKGWSESVKEMFCMILSRYYVEKKASDPINKKPLSKLTEGVVIPFDLFLKGYILEKFKEHYSDEFCELAHIPGNALNIKFLEDVFESEWAKTGKKAPSWAKEYL